MANILPKTKVEGSMIRDITMVHTSQMIHHCGASLSKQAANVLFCHWYTAGLSLSTVCGYKLNLIMQQPKSSPKES